MKHLTLVLLALSVTLVLATLENTADRNFVGMARELSRDVEAVTRGDISPANVDRRGGHRRDQLLHESCENGSVRFRRLCELAGPACRPDGDVATCAREVVSAVAYVNACASAVLNVPTRGTLNVSPQKCAWFEKALS